ADGDPRPHDRAGADADVDAELCARVDHRGRVDLHAHGRRSTTVASSSASATSWPSTNASPRIFIVRRFADSSVSWNLSWSPGTTGRRNFAPSMPTKYM